MMAMSKKMRDEPGEIEMLLPWHAAGTLNARDARRVEEALARDPELAKQYAVIREEYAETIHLNESLGAPSVRAMQKLFAAIDGEPVRKPSVTSRISTGIAQFFASLSPRTLAWSAGAAAFALLLQAGVIGTVLLGGQTYQTASLNTAERAAPAPMTRELAATGTPPRALVRFAPEAKMADINTLLDSYQATVLGGANGLFRLQFGSKSMSKDEVSGLMSKLRGEKIVSLAESAP
jgi:anti-sigma-K factor RskA